MKILIYSDSVNFGGAERYVLTLIKKLRNIGTEVFLCHKGRLLPDDEYKQTLLANTSNNENRLLKMYRIFKAIMTVKPDIVHVNSHVNFSCSLAIICSRLCSYPVIITVHISPFFRRKHFIIELAKRIIGKVLYSHILRYIFVSDYSRKAFCGYFLINCSKTTVIYNGIDDSWIENNAADKDLAALKNLADSCKLVGVVSRIEKGKGIDTFLDASEIVHQNIPESTFVIIGDGSEIKAQRSNDYVRYLGFKSNVADYLGLFNVFVMPSLSESFPYVIMEALYLGKPVVATRVGGVPELVKNGETGILIDPGDPGKMAGGIISMLNDNNLAKNLGERGQHEVKMYFSSERMARSTNEIYSFIAKDKALN